MSGTDHPYSQPEMNVRVRESLNQLAMYCKWLGNYIQTWRSSVT